MAAAKAAGLPSPYPVDETACASIHHLHPSRGQTIIGKTYLIIDAGAASADLQLFTVDKVAPLGVQEVALPPDAGKTAWCGGSYINDAAIKIVMDHIDINQGWHDLRIDKTPFKSREALEGAVAKEFDKKKKRFSGREALTLRVDDLKILVQPEEVMKAFAICLDAMTSMTDMPIESVSGAQAPPNTRTRRIDEIIATGGFRSVYLRDKYRGSYDSIVGSPARQYYPIPFTVPPDPAEISLTVGHDGALHGAEKGLLESRQLRRSFCVGRYEPTKPTHYAYHHSETS